MSRCRDRWSYWKQVWLSSVCRFKKHLWYFIKEINMNVIHQILICISIILIHCVVCISMGRAFYLKFTVSTWLGFIQSVSQHCFDKELLQWQRDYIVAISARGNDLGPHRKRFETCRECFDFICFLWSLCCTLNRLLVKYS